MILWQDMDNGAQPSSQTCLCPFHQHKPAKNPFHVPLFLQLLDLPDLDLYNLSLSHQLNDKKDGSLCSAFSTQYVFQMCPPCSMPFNTFQDEVVFSHLHTRQFTYPSISRWPFRLLKPSAYSEECSAVNTCVWVFIGLSPLYGTTMVSMVQQDCSPHHPMSLRVCKLPV